VWYRVLVKDGQGRYVSMRRGSSTSDVNMTEKDAFLSGKKLITIISDAGRP
jgi:hypothetical protein